MHSHSCRRHALADGVIRQASERRANKQQRASLAADPGRLAGVQAENEQLQLKLATLQVRGQFDSEGLFA